MKVRVEIEGKVYEVEGTVPPLLEEGQTGVTATYEIVREHREGDVRVVDEARLVSVDHWEKS